MARTVYFGSGSPYSWRVMLAMELKGLEYEAVELHFSKGDTQSAEHLARNPRGKIPVLIDGDITIYESTAIMAYLEKTYPEVPIFGADAREYALIWQRYAELENYLGNTISSILAPIFRGEAEGKDAEIKANLEKLKAELETVHGWLSGDGYIVGESLSAADVTLYPQVALLRRVGPRLKEAYGADFLNFEEKFPAFLPFMARIEALKNYDRTYPTHWRAAA